MKVLQIHSFHIRKTLFQNYLWQTPSALVTSALISLGCRWFSFTFSLNASSVSLFAQNSSTTLSSMRNLTAAHLALFDQFRLFELTAGVSLCHTFSISCGNGLILLLILICAPVTPLDGCSRINRRILELVASSSCETLSREEHVLAGIFISISTRLPAWRCVFNWWQARLMSRWKKRLQIHLLPAELSKNSFTTLMANMFNFL